MYNYFELNDRLELKTSDAMCMANISNVRKARRVYIYPKMDR